VVAAILKGQVGKMGTLGSPLDSSIVDAALAAAAEEGISISPEALEHLTERYARRAGFAPLSDERLRLASERTSELIREAIRIHRGRLEAGEDLDSRSISLAAGWFCRKFPDFWPYCPP
jgi:hypothetical protein